MNDNKKPNLNIPIQFQILSQFETEDTRFLKVKIWLMHLNENFNGSFFEKSIVETALPTLANTPILIYIEKNSDGEKDASDHRSVLIKEDGQYKIKYIGQAVGTIPESNNAQFEMRVCDDGIEREFVTVEGLMWTKFDDPIDIINRDKVKAESMELDENYTGDFGDDGLFHFSNFKFYGACILGKSVFPAMQNASIEVDFSLENLHKEIQEKMEQFKQFSMNQFSNVEIDNINSNNKEGGKNLVDEKLELLKKYNLTIEQLDFNLEEIKIEELEEKLNEFSNTQNTKPEISFSATYRQKRDALSNALDPKIERDADDNIIYEEYMWVEDFDDQYVFVEKSIWTDNNHDCKYGRFTYTFDEDSLIATISGEFEEMVLVWLTLDENQKLQDDRGSLETMSAEFEILKTKTSEFEATIETLNTEISTLKTSNEELSNYKNNNELEIHTNNINEVFSDFEESLKENETYTTLKFAVEKDIMNFNVDTLKKDLLAILGELNFSKTNKKAKPDKVVAPVINPDNSEVKTSRYGKYEQFIEKQE